MCGIAGFLELGRSKVEMEFYARKMSRSLSHRGPDEEGVWVDQEKGVALGHRRLSILDLSPAGSQPMHSKSRRYVIVFNGEIYNHGNLRKKLGGSAEEKKHCWRGHSDTEVILEAIETWGLKASLREFIGMFAFALWDRQKNLLSLVRDRLGEKPLYYSWQKGVFLFASELKALKVHPSFQAEINRNAITLLLRHGYIPAPHCIYKSVFKLLPGSFLTISPLNDQSIHPEYYWDVHEIVEACVNNPFRETDAEAVQQLDELLRDSIGQQMVADVPLGAFLSGGIDSSTVVALMQAQSARPVKTFTIGFNEDAFDEARYARSVARHLGTDHTELYVTPSTSLAVIPDLPRIFDEPFADASQIPTYCISRLTRQHVTVSLSGDGGDELFSGYDRYFLTRDIWKTVGWVPKSVRRAFGSGIVHLRADFADRWFRWLMPLARKYGMATSPSGKLRALSHVISADDSQGLYYLVVSGWKEPSRIVVGAFEPRTVFTSGDRRPPLPDFIHQMMYLDLTSYLPDDILVKVDRAAMAVSLETRVPMLDHRVVEFAWRLPLAMKIRNGQGKWLLRQVLNQYVPKELIDRPKSGFAVPLGIWLRGPLREWAESLLSERRLRTEGFFKAEPVRDKWLEHLSGKFHWEYYLWSILMFQAWLENEN
jgi:asparagine synthase (glutamine-hydrolysing)